MSEPSASSSATAVRVVRLALVSTGERLPLAQVGSGAASHHRHARRRRPGIAGVRRVFPLTDLAAQRAPWIPMPGRGAPAPDSSLLQGVLS